MSDGATALKIRLRKALETARQARRVEERKLHAIRDGAQASLRDLSVQELMSLLEDEIIAWRAAAAEYDRLGYPEDARRLQAQAALVMSYLAD
ncbi:hypothetical protein KRR38_29840 [Novosphingobium sp. G106]|uniref:hypothetical protein n=1 Tax=Novosphingobium sp. G106 TaxID=2849500 RepID=UPI001C2DD728|nr:hypothetical protein [Novosphingobium sp. G106]MBV1691768.1 hypothetical protein [Novosphingobium sp. G106]